MRVDDMEELSPARVRLTIEMAADEVDQTPADELAAALAARAVEATHTRGLVPLRKPVIDIADRDEAQPLRATAVVDVRPPIQVPDLGMIRAEIEPLDVSDAEVDERLDILRRDYVSVFPVDRPAEVGDIVQINLRATIDGIDVAHGRADGIAHEVGSGHVLSGLDEALIGMGAGQSASITTRLVGGQDAGQDADLAITVVTVSEKQMLDFDDEFAQLVAETTIEELRQAVRTELAQARRADRVLAARDQAIAALFAEVGPLPVDELIREDADMIKKSLRDDLQGNGRTLEQFLKDEGMTEAEMEASILDSASRRLHCYLILDAIADQEGINISEDEFRQIIAHSADNSQAPLRAFTAQLIRTNMMAPLYLDARRQKTLSHVLRNIAITDTDGKIIPVTDLEVPG